MKKAPLILFVIFLITSCVLQAQWKPANGPLGYVSCMVGIPNSTGGTNLFVGTKNGVYLSTDNGVTWSNRGLNNYSILSLVVINTSIFAAAISQHDYYYQDTSNVFLSTDNGLNWNEAGSGLIRKKDYPDGINLLTCPNETGGNDLFAFKSTGVFLSTNNGVNWNLIDSNLYSSAKTVPNGHGGCNLIATNPNSILLSTNYGESWTSIHDNSSRSEGTPKFYILGTKILAKFKNGFFLSTDYGKNWDTTNVGSDLLVSGNCVESRTNFGDTIDVVVSYRYTYISKDNGKNWTIVNSDLAFLNITSLIAIPNGSGGDNIYAGTANGDIYLSTDNGKSWNGTSYGLGSDIIASICSSSPEIKSTGTNGTYLYATVKNFKRITSHELFLSTNGGTSWSSISKGLPDSDILSFASNIDASGTYTIYAGAYNGLYSSTNNGISWIADTNGLSDEIYSIAVFNNNNNIFVNTYSFPEGHRAIFLSTDKGCSWDSIPNNYLFDNGKSISAIAVSPNNIGGANLFVGTSRGSVYLSSDLGANWSCIGDSISKYDISSITTHTNTTGGIDVFACSDNGIFLSSNLDKNWALLSNHSFYPAIYIFDNYLFSVSRKDSIYLSTDNGKSWKDISGNLSGIGITSLTLADNYLYAAGQGVWRRPLSEVLTSVKDKPNSLPYSYSLQQNYPNPFNPSTVIEFQLPKSGFVTLKVYDVLGREVKTLVNEYKAPGKYSARFDARNLSSGIYFYHLRSNDFSITKKMILVK